MPGIGFLFTVAHTLRQYRRRIQTAVMKKAVLILAMAICGLGAGAQGRNFQHLVGKWEAVDADNRSGGIEVVDSSKIFLVYGSERKQITGYKADFSKSPCWFDFTIQDSAQTVRLQSLLQFINDDLVQWQVFEGSERPVHFVTNTGDILYLRRKK